MFYNYVHLGVSQVHYLGMEGAENRGRKEEQKEGRGNVTVRVSLVEW